MQSSFLYHVYGIRGMRCIRSEYKGNTVILHVQRSEPEKRCPCCGGRTLVMNGYRSRDLLGVPVGGRRTIIRVRVQRYKCRRAGCGYDAYERIPFASGNRSYTKRFARYVVELLRIGTIKGVARLLGVSWDLVKDIHRQHLRRHYARPSLKGLKNIGIDEFAVRKGHVYKTIVVNLDTGAIVHVGDGKGAEALEGFWKRVKRDKVVIKNIATDLSSAFINSIAKHAPGAVNVFDHFHVVKLMGMVLDDIRRVQYAMEKDINKRKVLKGARYLLLRNGEDVMDKAYRTRLENALSMNEPLTKGYYLKEALRQIWRQDSRDKAEATLLDWVRQARESKVKQLVKMANTMMAFRTGILAWYDDRLSTAKVEGINNKIKVMKRNAYGFRDNEYFKLRLFALHDCNITQNVG